MAKLERLEAALSEAQKMIGRQSEELGLYREYLRIMNEGRGRPAQQQQEEGLFSEEEGLLLLERPHEGLNRAAKKLLEYVRKEINQTVEARSGMSEYGQRLRDAFYQTYKHLQGYEDIVGLVTQRIAAENPHTPPHMLLDKIAKAADEYIEGLVRRRTGTKTGVEKQPTGSKGQEVTEREPNLAENEKELLNTLKFANGLK